MACSHSQGLSLFSPYTVSLRNQGFFQNFVFCLKILCKGDMPIFLIYNRRDLNCDTFPSPLMFWRCVVFISLLWIRPSYQFSWSVISLPFFRSASLSVLLLIYSSVEWYKMAFIIQPGSNLTTHLFLAFYVLFHTLVPHINVSFNGL